MTGTYSCFQESESIVIPPEWKLVLPKECWSHLSKRVLNLMSNEMGAGQLLTLSYLQVIEGCESRNWRIKIKVAET